MSAPWIKLDTGFFNHLKPCELLTRTTGRAAIASLMEMWCWAGSSDTPDARDGHVSDAVVKRLGLPRSHTTALKDAGFIARNGTGWHIHGWTEYQGALLTKRADDAAKKRRQRDAKVAT